MMNQGISVVVHNHLSDDLVSPDIKAWKNIQIWNKQTVEPRTMPAEFFFEYTEPRKELKITADPARKDGKDALLNITLSSKRSFDTNVSFLQEQNIDKWVVDFSNISPRTTGTDDERYEEPPVVNVSVGQDL